MAVTDPEAVQFSTDRIRESANRLARTYYLCDAARDRWDGLGGGQDAIDVMEQQVREAADSVLLAYEFAFRTENLWFLLGGTSLIPNDVGEVIFDNDDFSGPRVGWPEATGQQAVAVIDRDIQLQNWLRSSTGDFADTARNSLAFYNTVLACTSEGPAMTVANAGNFMTRCSELRTRYQANTKQELGVILAYANSPQG